MHHWTSNLVVRLLLSPNFNLLDLLCPLNQSKRTVPISEKKMDLQEQKEKS